MLIKSVILTKPVLKKLNVQLCCLCTATDERFHKLFYDDEARKPTEKTDTPKQTRARSIRVLQHFTSESHLNDVKDLIPSKYFVPKRRLTSQHLYLVDKEVAKNVASYMLLFLHKNDEQLVCETNAGLGLIASELLDAGVNLVRLYETCVEFRQVLKNFSTGYSKRIELFARDIYYLGSLSNLDKQDRGDRVEQLLKGTPKRSWSDDPVMTIVGPMANLGFIHYLIKMLTLQQQIITYGRIQIFALMRPMDYVKLTASADMSLHTYQVISILFQLLFESQILDKYPRKSFLPWETKLKESSYVHQHSKVDTDYIYLVRINLKKTLPVETGNLLHLYYFIKQGFFRGKPKVIPTVEKWIPGIGAKLIVPKAERKLKSFKNMNIYTEFGHLTPIQILQIFLEMLEHPEYASSPFVAVAETQLLKTETIESDAAESKASHQVENLQEMI